MQARTANCGLTASLLLCKRLEPRDLFVQRSLIVVFPTPETYTDSYDYLGSHTQWPWCQNPPSWRAQSRWSWSCCPPLGFGTADSRASSLGAPRPHGAWKGGVGGENGWFYFPLSCTTELLLTYMRRRPEPAWWGPLRPSLCTNLFPRFGQTVRPR